MNFSPASLLSLAAAVGSLLLTSCQIGGYAKDVPPRAVVKDGVVVTVRDQKLAVFKGGRKVKDYDVSTSKFGLGTTHGSKRTPLGIHAVSQKTGEGQPKGMVFKGARPTGEVVAVDAFGRDPIVTRVIQLAGLENANKNSHSRRIYIHGTPEERKIGRPASYGCIRMKSDDVVDLFGRVHRGMPVAIESCSQKTYLEAEKNAAMQIVRVPEAVVAKLPTDTQVRLRATGHRYSKRTLASSRHSAKNGKKGGSSKKRVATNSRGKKLVTRRSGRRR